MRVMVIVKANKSSEAGVVINDKTSKLMADMQEFNEQLGKAGVFLMGEGLHPSSKGKRVKIEGRNRTVVDGPFAETKELVAGFWLWQVRNMEEALEWVRRCPNPHEGDSEIEIRPVLEPEDFGEAFTPELQENLARLRREQAERQKA